MDAFLQMGIAQIRPFGGKFGIRFQQRHEIGGKGGVAAAGLGAYKALGGDLHQPQRFLCHDVDIDEDIIQHRKIRRLAARHAGAIGPLAGFQCTLVIFQHMNSFLKSGCGAHPVCRTIPVQYTMKFDFVGEFGAEKC